MPGWGGRAVSAARYREMIRVEAALLGIDVEDALAGRKGRAGVVVRARVWRALVERGYSKQRIAAAAGVDRTTVRDVLRDDPAKREALFAARRRTIDPWADVGNRLRPMACPGSLARSVGA